MPSETTVMAKAGKVADANPKRCSLNSTNKAMPKKIKKALIMAKIKAKISVIFLAKARPAVPCLAAMMKLEQQLFFPR